MSGTEQDTRLAVCGFTVDGISVGGQQTCIIFPELKLAFDTGRCPVKLEAARWVAISHTHMDHIAGIGPYLATRSLHKMGSPSLLVPSGAEGGIRGLIAAFSRLDGSDFGAEVAPISPADGSPHMMGKRCAVRAFPTCHTEESQGYVVYERREKLKEGFQGCTGEFIKRMRASGHEVTRQVETPLVAFTGDTTIDWLWSGQCSDALRAKILVTECTFLDDSVPPERARDYLHTHIRDLAENASAFQENEAVILTHFSMRYRREQIPRLISQGLPQALRDKVTPLLNGFP